MQTAMQGEKFQVNQRWLVGSNCFKQPNRLKNGYLHGSYINDFLTKQSIYQQLSCRYGIITNNFSLGLQMPGHRSLILLRHSPYNCILRIPTLITRSGVLFFPEAENPIQTTKMIVLLSYAILKF